MNKLIALGSITALLALGGCGSSYRAEVPEGLPGTKQVIVIENDGSLDQKDFLTACGEVNISEGVPSGATTPSPLSNALKVTRLPDWDEDLSAVIVSCR